MQIYYPENQKIVFLYFLAVGVFLGIVFDVLRIKREFFGTSRLVLFFDDLAYMLFCTCVLILGVFRVNNGNLRWFEFFSPCIGFLAYRATLSKLVIKFFFFLSRLIKRIFRAVCIFLLRILKTIFKPVFKLLSHIAKNLRRDLTETQNTLYTYSVKIKMIKACKNVC